MRLILGEIMALSKQLLRRSKIAQALLILDKENLSQRKCFKNTNENEVRKIVKNLNVCKTCECSEIPTKIIKLI